MVAPYDGGAGEWRRERESREQMESIDQRRRWWGTGVLALVATLVLVATGCAKSDTGSSAGTTSSTVAANVGLAGAKITGPTDLTTQPKTGGQLSFGIEAETEGMDPTRNAFSSAGHVVASAVYDPIVTTDDKGKVVPYLAERFSSTPDFTTWSFDIRSGVTFHDGEPLTADIVKQNLEAHRVSPISALALRAVSQVDVVAPNTVKVTLSEPMASFPTSSPPRSATSSRPRCSPIPTWPPSRSAPVPSASTAT